MNSKGQDPWAYLRNKKDGSSTGILFVGNVTTSLAVPLAYIPHLEGLE